MRPPALVIGVRPRGRLLLNAFNTFNPSGGKILSSPGPIKALGQEMGASTWLSSFAASLPEPFSQSSFGLFPLQHVGSTRRCKPTWVYTNHHSNTLSCIKEEKVGQDLVPDMINRIKCDVKWPSLGIEVLSLIGSAALNITPRQPGWSLQK